MIESEKTNNTEQNNQQLTEMERVLGSMPSFEEHMMELKNEKQRRQNEHDLNSIQGVMRSRDRDDLDEAINERLDKIELAKANGQFVSEEDWNFAIEHGGGPHQSTGGGDFRRIDLISKKEDNHFKTANYVEDQKSNSIDQQNQIERIKRNYLDNLEMDILAGDKNPSKISETTQKIDSLNQLSSTISQVDDNIKQPHLRTNEEIEFNQQAIKDLGQKLEKQNSTYDRKI